MAPKILVLDDDETFTRRLSDHARRSGVEVMAYSSLHELGSIGRLGEFDAIIVGLALHPVNGLEIADYASRFFPGLPVLLVSEHRLPLAGTRWATSVAGVVNRYTPAREILSWAADLAAARWLHAPGAVPPSTSCGASALA